MGELRIEIEYFKEGLPADDGDYNEYGIHNYKNAVYAADVALDDGIADEVAFYLSVEDQEPIILTYTKNTFDVEKVSEKINELIKQAGE